MATIQNGNVVGTGSIVPSTVGNLPINNPNTALQTPGTSGTPTLNATFAQPASKTIPPPTVVTSDAANDHVNTMQTASNQMNADSQNAQAANTATNAANAQASAAQPTSTETSAQPDISSQISELMGTMGNDSQGSNDINSEEGIVSDDQNAINDLQDQQTNLYNTMNAYSSGSVPLTSTEQTQVADVAQNYSAALGDATNYANNISAWQTAMNAQSGIQEYSPSTAASNLKQAMQAGAQRVAKVNSDIVNAQTKLTTALQNGDYKSASDAYAQVGKLISDRQNEISTVNTAIDREQTQMENAQKDALTALMDQNTISYQQKQQAIAQSTLDEKTKADIASEATAREVAEKGTYQIKTNPDGSTSIFNTSTGQIMGGGRSSSDVSADPTQPLVSGTGQDMQLNSSSPTVNQAFSVTASGVPYLDMSEITDTSGKLQAAQIAQQYQAETGNPLPMVTAKNAPILQNIDATRTALSGIQDALNGLSPSNGVTRPFDTVGHFFESLTEMGPSASKIASYDTWKASMIQAIKGISGAGTGGTRGATLINELMNDIPKINDTTEDAKTKIDAMNKLLDASERSIVGNQSFEAANPSQSSSAISSFLQNSSANASTGPASFDFSKVDNQFNL